MCDFDQKFTKYIKVVIRTLYDCEVACVVEHRRPFTFVNSNGHFWVSQKKSPTFDKQQNKGLLISDF